MIIKFLFVSHQIIFVLASISTKTVQQAHFIACKGTKIFTNHQISVLFLLKFHNFSYSTAEKRL